jgi:DNA repair protein SbcD/Mre11
MRIAHMSDLHYATETLAEVDKCFTYAVDDAIQRNAEAAVISGDATDHELGLHTPAVEALAQQVKRLSDHCPVLMLQGTFSHEPPGTLSIFRLLGGRYPLFVADRIQQVALVGDAWVASDEWCFESLPAHARCVFCCVPTVNKATVAAVVGATGAGEAVGQEIARLLAGFGPVNEQARTAGIPTVAVSHGTVNGCVTEHGVPMAGLDHEFTEATLFSAQASAFLLGHIHKHQSWACGTRLAAYPGSIGRLHYGEEGDKGYLLWDVGETGASLQFVPTPARRMVHLEFAGRPDMATITAATAESQGAFVRVRWSVAEEDQQNVDRDAIMAALAGAAAVKLEGRVIPVVRARAEGISLATTLADKVHRWAGLTQVDAGGLLERLALIDSQAIEQIVEGIASGAASGGVAVKEPADAALPVIGGNPSPAIQIQAEAATAELDATPYRLSA